MAKARSSDPFAPKWFTEFRLRKSEKAPKVKRITRQALEEVVAKTCKPGTGIATTPAMELTARHPFDPAGFMDSYHPGRWDCEYNLVFMTGIHSTGPSIGMWDGTVMYVRFKAASSGTYLVVGNFSGYQTTMNLNGPWGNTSAYSPTTSTSAAVTALWTGTAGQQLFFTMSCLGIIGYLESIQIFQLS
jgi:hypothetical protein